MITTTVNPLKYGHQNSYSDRYQYRLGEKQKFGQQTDYNARQKDLERAIKVKQQAQLDELSKQRKLQQEQQIKFQQMKLLEEQKKQQEQKAIAELALQKRNKNVEIAPLYPDGSENFDYYEEYLLTTPLPTQQVKLIIILCLKF